MDYNAEIWLSLMMGAYSGDHMSPAMNLFLHTPPPLGILYCQPPSLLVPLPVSVLRVLAGQTVFLRGRCYGHSDATRHLANLGNTREHLLSTINNDRKPIE